MIWRRFAALPAPTILMMAFLLSRILGMVKQILLTALIGTTGIAPNAYVNAFRVPDLVFNLVSGGALASAFIPTFAGYLAKNSEAAEAEGWRVASTVFYVTIALLLPVLIGAMILAPRFVPLMTGPDNTALIAATVPLTRIMLLQPLFMALITLCQGVSNSYMRFTAPALAPLVYNLSIIAGILVGHFVGVVAVAWSLTIGAGLQLLVQLPYLPQGRRLFRLAFAVGSSGVHEIGRLMLPRVFGQAGVQVTFLATTVLGDMLRNNPNGALLNGWTVILLPVGIFASALATTAFPVMARQAASTDLAGFARTVSQTMRMVFFLTVPAAAGLILLAPEVVRVLYAHGDSANALAVHLTTLAIVYYAVGIPGHALAEVLPRSFYAIRDTRTPVLVVLWTLSMAIFLSVMAVKVLPADDDKVAGLALAISIAVLLEAAGLTIALHRAIPEFTLGSLGWALARVNVAAGAMTAGLGWVTQHMEHGASTGFWGSCATLAICIPLGAVGYLAVALLLGVPEAMTVLSRVRSRVGI
jgi:putative peptidoglycan lipid II flippase